MLPSWIRSRSDIPRPMYFLATLTTSRRFASAKCRWACAPSVFTAPKCIRNMSSFDSSCCPMSASSSAPSRLARGTSSPIASTASSGRTRLFSDNWTMSRATSNGSLLQR